MGGGDNRYASGWTLILIFAIFYFLIIRPQQKQKELRAMLSALGKGDKVVTNSGIHGRSSSWKTRSLWKLPTRSGFRWIVDKFPRSTES